MSETQIARDQCSTRLELFFDLLFVAHKGDALNAS